MEAYLEISCLMVLNFIHHYYSSVLLRNMNSQCTAYHLTIASQLTQPVGQAAGWLQEGVVALGTILC